MDAGGQSFYELYSCSFLVIRFACPLRQRMPVNNIFMKVAFCSLAESHLLLYAVPKYRKNGNFFYSIGYGGLPPLP